MIHHGTYGSPWDLHATPSRDLRTTWMPMAPHRTETQLEYRWLTMGLTLSQLGCQWLFTGHKLNSDADGPPWDLHTTRMPTAHYGTYTQLEYRWPSIELSHNTGADGSPWDLHILRIPIAHPGTYTQLGCRWLTIGLIRNTDADDSSWDLHTTRMLMAL